MSLLNLFIPIHKIDAKQRLVYGTISEEITDKSGEMLDYESAKPQFQKWSDEQHKISGGKSKGNLRAMHDNIAAGKFTEISFDDDAKKINGVAKVVDDSEWAKVESGVYCGFSIGGGYAKRWKDPTNPGVTRYTPELAEVSLVDNPCVPTATFEFIKEDGSTELRKFNSSAQEAQHTMTNTDMTKDERPQDKGGVEQVWKAKDGSTHLSKAAALKRNEEVEAQEVAAPTLDAIAKLDEALSKGSKKKEEEDEDEEKEGDDEETKKEKAARKAKKKEEAEKAKKAEEDEAEKARKAKEDEDAAEKAGKEKEEKAKKDQKEGDKSEDDEKEKKPKKKEKAASEKSASGDLKKGMHGVSHLAHLLDSINCLLQSSSVEEAIEGDDSEMPEKLKAWLKDGADLLRDMVAEETAELADDNEEDDDVLAMSAAVRNLSKAGARHSKTDMERVQKMHDLAHEMHKCMGDMVEKCDEMHKSSGEMKNTAIDLGAEGDKTKEDEDKAEKAVASELSKMTTKHDALVKVISDLAPKVGEMLKRVESQNDLMAEQAKRIAHLEDQPMPAKGALRRRKRRLGSHGSGCPQPAQRQKQGRNQPLADEIRSRQSRPTPRIGVRSERAFSG